MKGENLISEDEILNNDFIEATPRLTVDEINYRLYINDVLKYPVLSDEEEKILLTEYKVYGSEEARQKLINSNLRLVIYVIKKYIRRNKTVASVCDLIQEGNLGLIKALERYDIKKGTKLSTYAVPWIRHYAKRYVDTNANAITIPVWANELKEKFLEFQEAYAKENFKEPSEEEYLKNLGIKKKQLQAIKNTINEVKSLEDVIPYGNFLESIIEDSELKENFEDEVISDADSDVIWKEIETILNPRQFDVILRRYGKKINDLGCEYIETLDEVSEVYNVSSKRIFNIESQALKKLKKSKKLNKYFN